MSKTARYALNKNKYLLNPEYDRLIHILKTYKDKDHRDTALLFLALNTGARAQELLNLEFADFDTHEETVFIKGLKNSNDRELPIPSWLFRHCHRLSERQMRPFDISYNRLLQIWHFYRPVHKKFHSLRHTFAIRLYQRTKDIRLLQVALGHRNITNTMIYADYIYTQSELKKLLL